MHSRIFQISKEPISKDNRLSLEDYYEETEMQAIGVDWFAKSEDYKGDIQWLVGSLGDGFEYDEKNNTIKVVNKELYFKSMYDEYKKNLDALVSKSDFDAFVSGNIEGDIYLVNESYCDKYGFYFDDRLSCDNGSSYWGYPVPLSRYLRSVDNGTVLYLGSVIDYHF